MTYKEAKVYLDEMSKYGSVFGLATIRNLLRELGNPQDDLKFIHIAGTNGKGSVLACTSTILSKAGYRTGRYVSPTVISYLERIQIDGKWITEEEFAKLTEKVKEAIARMKAAGQNPPTVFEAETAIAFLFFKEMHCDLVVLETGLGGALDATNIVKNTVCAVFTTISLDHLGVIGNTLDEIAESKSGIIKPGCVVISARQQQNVYEILKKKAAETECPYTEAQPEQMQIEADDFHGIKFSYQEFKNMISPLAGRCQIDNLSVVLEVIRCLRKLGYQLSDESVRQGLAKTYWPGRLTCLMEQPLFLIDGAHNEDAARKLRMSIERYFPGKQLILIMGVFKDKEYEKIAQILCPLAKSVYTVNLPNHERTLPAQQLKAVADTYCLHVKAEESRKQAVMDAISEAEKEDVIIACGSLSYLGEVIEIIEKMQGKQTLREEQMR